MAETSTNRTTLPVISAIAVPTIILVILTVFVANRESVFAAIGLANSSSLSGWVDKILWATFIMVGFLLGFRLLSVILLEGLVRRSLGRPVPRILHDILGLLFAVLAALVAVNVLFNGALSGVLAFSGILGIVVGLALRPIILDAFSGLSANLEAAFQIGDWITINDGSISYTGWVDQINWRTTNIRTREGNLIVCPNSTFGTSVVTNHSRPFVQSRYEVRIKLPPEVPAEKGTALLLQAVNAATELPGGPGRAKSPDVLIDNMTDSGIEYRVRYWLDPASESYDTATHVVNASVQRHLQFAGLRLASDREEVALGRQRPPQIEFDQAPDRVSILSALPLLNGLSRTTLATLAQNLQVRWFEEDTALVKEDDDSTGMFIVIEGKLNVTKQDNGQRVLISQLQPGDYFGEMSLLTGAPRSATVTSVVPCRVFEIDRGAMQTLLAAEPEVMRTLSLNLARRQVQTNQALAAASRPPLAARESEANYFLEKMKALFRFTRSPFPGPKTER